MTRLSTMHLKEPGTAYRQQGAVLIVSLIMLLLLTFIGVAAMNTANTQEKMVGSLQDQQVAFEMAELSLKAGEDWLLNLLSLPDAATDPTPGDGYVWARDATKAKVSATDVNWWEKATAANFWDAEGNDVSLNTALVRASINDDSWLIYQEPQYVIEQLQTITGTGGGGSAGIGISDGSVSSTVYRIVARGVGGRPDTIVLLEGIYAKQ